MDPDERGGLFGLIRSGAGLLDRGMRAVTPENIKKIPGLIDAAMRHIGENPLDFLPGVGDVRGVAAGRELTEEGRPLMGLLAAAGALPMIPGGIARFRGPMKAAAEAGDPRRATSLLGEMRAARDVPLTPGARVARAVPDAPVQEGRGTFSLFDSEGMMLPGNVKAKIVDGSIDVTMPVSDVAMAGQQALGREGIQQTGRQLIEAFEKAGHEVTSISGFRASGARAAPGSLPAAGGSELELPRSFFFR